MADKRMDTSKIDALYSWLSYDLQKMKAELMKELKYSSVQAGSLYQELKADREKSSQAISQEIRYSYKQNQTIYDGLASMINNDFAAKLGSIEEKAGQISEAVKAQVEEIVAPVKEACNEIVAPVKEACNEIKYAHLQQGEIYNGIVEHISEDVVTKLEEMQGKIALLEQIEKALDEISTKVADTEAAVAESNRQLAESVAANANKENLSQQQLVEEVGDKVLTLLSQVGFGEMPEEIAVDPVEVEIDYDKIVYGTAEKVVESLPLPERVDYRRIDSSFAKAAQGINVGVSEETLSSVVSAALEKALAAIDVDAIADKVAEKLSATKQQPAEVNYELLADMVAQKLAAKQDKEVTVCADSVNNIANKVAEKVPAPVKAPEFDYEKMGDIVEEKLANQPEKETTYELVLDEEGIQAIAGSVTQELYAARGTFRFEEEQPVEETTEEVAETPVEEPYEYAYVQVEEPVEEVYEPVVEETAEEPVAEVYEEPAVEETAEEGLGLTAEEAYEEPVEEVYEPVVEETAAEEEPVEMPLELSVTVEETPVEELAVAVEETPVTEIDLNLVNAESGLVIRKKKSFTAKIKQSDESIKMYYSDLKNELTSYKKINSNVSWHGDRFNYGRDTVAKVNVCGKTLCFYVALDPDDPELKSTVYHQKNVGNQRAYESTPFMVKVKSDAAAKKALRLVGYLAEKLGTEKDEEFTPVDYTQELAYEDDDALEAAGHIKSTKEKKVELDF